MVENSYIALLITFLVALVWLRANYFTAEHGWINSQLSRKIIHTGTGFFFVLCWLLFPQTSSSRYLAALVPSLFTIQFMLVGAGIIHDRATVQSISRTGDHRELLKGPLLYGLVFILITMLFWFDSPTGMIALMILCGGDGLADIIGTRFGHRYLPWNQKKTWIGSIGMFIAGSLFSLFVLAVFIQAGQFSPPVWDYLLKIAVMSAAATMVESLPIRDFDNLTITLASVVLGLLLF